MRKFQKPAENPDQLLDRLIGRGLIVADRAAALAYLKYVGGYRLKGFWFHLTDPSTKRFRTCTTFDDIIQRYEFDRQLRKLAFDEIGRIEIAVRCVISDRLSQQYGPHCHHARLLRAKFVISPQRYAKRNIRFSDPNSFHAHATVMNFLMRRTGMPTVWRMELDKIFSRFTSVNPAEIGFARGWESKNGW